MPTSNLSIPGMETTASSFLAPLCDAWTARIEQAKKSKALFNAVASQCDSFFCGPVDFMWETKFKDKYMGRGITAPKFQVTINKAFELVALYGPSLFWRYPNVAVKSHEKVAFEPEFFGDPNDPNMQQFIQMAGQEQELDQKRSEKRNDLMQKYLNYAQREQPDGLASHAILAIREALVKGRGCLWIETYKMPGSDSELTGAFFDSVDNLQIDPDCKDPTLRTAEWIARKHVTPAWRLERKFGLPKGSMDDIANWESADSQAVRNGDDDRVNRVNGMTSDLVTWYEIWSKCGVGGRIQGKGTSIPGMNESILKGFDEVVGDYAYLCIAKGCHYPLNAYSLAKRQPDDIDPDEEKIVGDEDVAEMFKWPFPTYLDDRWPVACLDFYAKYNSAWPVAPMAPGLGPLICLNILTAAFVENAFENRKQIIAAKKSALEALRAAIVGTENPAIVEVNDAAHGSINEMLAFVNRPEMNADPIKAIEYMATLFDKSTGLSEIMYSMNVGGAASRTATDVNSKEEKASIRPDQMSKDVGDWLTKVFELQKIMAALTVTGQSLQPFLGKYGAMMWEDLIENEDPEMIVREMDATVEASDVRKPNHARDATNIQTMLQSFGTIIGQYSAQTGDTQPINAIMETYGEAIVQDVSGWKLGPWQPQPPPPEVQQAEQAKMQLEQQKLQGDVQNSQADLQMKQFELEMKQIEAQMQQHEDQIAAARAEMELQTDAAKTAQGLQADAAKADQGLAADTAQGHLDLRLKEAMGQQALTQQRQQALYNLMSQRALGDLKLSEAEEASKIKLDAARAQAKIVKAKPKPTATGKKK